MRIVFVGTGEFGVPAMEALRAAGHEIIAAVSQPDRPAGRGRQLQPTPIRTAAERLGIPHTQAQDINVFAPREIAPTAELGLVVAFGQKIGPAWLNAFFHGCINIHGSLLPRYRGAAPYQWAVINGDAETGVTVFRLNERWDAGPILGMARTPIGDTETADELHDRLARLGAELIPDVVHRIETGTAIPLPQDAAVATRAPKLTRADSAIDWSQPAGKLVRRINGLWSWPTAVCTLPLAGSAPLRVQLARAALVDASTPASKESPPGTLAPDGIVQCGAGRVQLLEIKPAGGKCVHFADFANGRRLNSPMQLGPAES